MFRRIIGLAGCFFVIVLIGCVQPTIEPKPTALLRDIETNSNDFLHLVDVTSTSNTTVLIIFSKPMGNYVEDVSLYKIIRPQVCDVQDWYAQLSITKAELNDDNTSVTLTTMAQTAGTYQLVVTGVRDQVGNQLMGRDAGERLTFVGTPPSEVVDSDGDGIADSDEQYGWTVRIGLSDGRELCKYVTSDPMKSDTDNDEVGDNIEMAISTNPRSPDTDGDDLNDKSESEYASSPIHQDSDQDGITDGMEAKVYKTSPALRDTDGDGVSDYEEIISGGRNPRLADLPQLDLQLYGDPAIVLNIMEGTTEKQISSSLEQDRSEYQSTDTVSNRMSIENTIRLHTEVEVGTSNWPPSANAKLTTDTEFKHSYVNDTSSSWTRNSVEDVKNTFEGETSATTTYHNGIVAVSMKLVNKSDLNFKLKSPRVMAYRMTPGGNFSVIGALEPGKLETSQGEQHWVPDSDTNEYVMGPGGAVTLLLGTGDLPAQVMKPLMQNPSALTFEIASYSLFQLDELGVEETKSYDKVGEDVLARTGLIVIDYGDGRVERYSVATNLRRNADGSGSGVKMKEALSEIIALDYETIETQNGDTVLYRVGKEMLDSNGDGEYDRFRYEAYPKSEGESENEKGRGFWLVGGTQEIFQTEDVPNFDDIEIKNGDRVSLVWVEDQDGDGLTDREEYLLGTDMRNVDTDEDGLSDYYESKEGWNVKVDRQTPYSVLPDPRFADSDGDGWTDKYESDAATDPYLKDTDGDDEDDPDDLYPLSICMKDEYNKFNMVSWWIPWYGPYSEKPGEEVENMWYAKDIWTDNEYNQPGELFGYQQREDGIGIIREDGNDTYISLNRGPITDEQYIFVEEQDDRLSPEKFTIAAWIKWDGELASGEDRATLVTKGNQNNLQYALYIKENGSIQFDLHRRVREKCCCTFCFSIENGIGTRYKSFDNTERVSTEPNIIKKGTLHHVVAIFDLNHMKIYVDSVRQGDFNVIDKHKSRANWYERYTEHLLINQDPLIIGNTLDGTNLNWSFKGMILDVQFFHDALIEDDVAKLYKYGICVPEH